MSVNKIADKNKVTVQIFRKMKEKGQKISMLTAYDYTMAKLVDQAGIDAILVGDSAGNVMAGYETTLSVTLDEIIYHAKSVKRAVKNALIVVDMPFGTCSGDPKDSLHNAIRIMRETGAEALKIEGGEELLPDIRKIIAAGIPVMGHLGLMPQSVHQYGGFGLRAKSEMEAQKLKNDAALLEEAGCFAVTLEKVPAALAEEIALSLRIPVIGIGAGSQVDGQVLVVHDMLGLNQEFLPKFVRKYAELGDTVKKAVNDYILDVKNSDFPSVSESYENPTKEVV
ncbi:3-methyl-2-oxobutanoate hydroxymethyltransferase [Chryseobacterium luquanense]|uniref:3-methyl-2-oxobutanoate hydroxymethyltransferase n=1 Tax=Chryseobacterium luquanense TaxID=2983766 RepID=A0ABT3Y7L3_9FLAO|nr:3-methyl-2-oxobutanoate hydroxymethyltransferase [Chryseobacterium luquanense]MCX8534145.1 3-methyl-2-oxobutanoate hydroxymethyltransferase [Chryseobacterium luquanense]